MNIAVIPARGGSKRVPRKNVRSFGGKPMIVHSIVCCLESGVFDRIIVSTDDDEIASVARNAGAETPFLRPAKLSDDHAGTTEVVAHAVTQLLKEPIDLSAVCCVYATAPFMLAEDIKRGLRILETRAWDYVFSATSFSYPIQRSFRITDAGAVEMFFQEHFESRSQDLPEALHDAGQFYWGMPRAWVDGDRIFGERSSIVRVPRWRVHDIDTQEDWDHALLFWDALHARSGV